ncbi:MAG: sugar transporter permease protein [Lachnospiraceae bacterium]|nr:sugar transporter permease protein [Lachnospiraceae bacterium]
MKIKHRGKIIAFCFCLAIAILWVTPVLFSFMTSLKSEIELKTNGFNFLPKAPTGENYSDLLTKSNSTTPIFLWFKNSFIVSGIHTILVLIVASTSAFAYARLEFKGKNTLFWIIMATMMFPSIINLIPLYKICDALNLINTKWAIILPGVGGAFNIFLMRQFMMGIPKELDEAAKIDGANSFQIYYRIIMPLSAPVLTVVAMFAFTGSWNDFLWPSLVINNIEKLTITPGMQLLKGTYNTFPAHALAGGVLAILPTFIFFLFAQKYFLKGMQLQSGVKG